MSIYGTLNPRGSTTTPPLVQWCDTHACMWCTVYCSPRVKQFLLEPWESSPCHRQTPVRLWGPWCWFQPKSFHSRPTETSRYSTAEVNCIPYKSDPCFYKFKQNSIQQKSLEVEFCLHCKISTLVVSLFIDSSRLTNWCGEWIDIYFDNVMTKIIINKKTSYT